MKKEVLFQHLLLYKMINSFSFNNFNKKSVFTIVY